MIIISSRFKFGFCLITFLILLFSTAEAQWQTNGPYGGSVKIIAVSPSDINIAFVGTVRGLFTTTDGGANWKATRITEDVNSIVIDPVEPNIVYVATNQGFYKSRNAGSTWAKGGGFSSAWQLAIDSLNHNVLYAATQEGLSKSEDGAFWEQLPLPLEKGIGVQGVAISPKDSKTVYAVSQGRWRANGYDAQVVFKSQDGGVSWKEIFNVQKLHAPGERAETQISSSLIDPASSQTLYLGLRWGPKGEIADVHKSLDGGGSWKQIFRQHAHIHAMAFDPKNSSTIYVGSEQGLFRLTEGGAKSELLRSFPSEFATTIAVSPKDPNTIYVGTNRTGLYKSTDSGKNWAFISSGITALRVWSVTVDSRNGQIYAGTENGVYKSSNAGGSWNLVAGFGQSFFQISPYPITADSVYAAGDNGVFKSFDGGKSWWTSSSIPRDAMATVAVAVSDPNLIYAGRAHGYGSSGVIYKSLDGGQNWTQIELRDIPQTHALAIDPADKNSLYGYFNTNTGEWSFYRSVDGGRTWTKGENFGDSWNRPNKIAVDPTKPGTVYVASDSGVQKSVDGGKSWRVVGFANRFVQLVLVEPGNPTALYATDGSEIQVSFDGGATWEPVASSAPQRITSLALDPQLKSIVYAGTEGGVYVFRGSGDLTPPATPTEVKASAEASKINVSWKPSPDADVAGYRIYYGSQPGVYTKIIDAPKVTSFAISELLVAPFHFIAVSAYDTSRNESKRSEEVSVTVASQIALSTSLSFKMSLPKGLSLVSLPVKPSAMFTARSFATKLNASFVIGLDPVSKKFIAFTPQVHTGDGFTIEGGRGYIVNLISSVETIFEGSGWSKAAPPADINSVWAFVVSGSIPDPDKLGYSQLKVRVRNRSRGQSAVEPIGLLEAEKFAVALVDLSKNSVANERDIFEIFIESTNGEILAGPISQQIGKREISEAQLIVNIRADEIRPRYTKLLQNYPNPFNPETWIPFQLSEDSEVKVQIYDVEGRVVRELNLGRLSAGIYADKGRSAYWDGRNGLGERVASGVYFYFLEAGNFKAVRKLAVSK